MRFTHLVHAKDASDNSTLTGPFDALVYDSGLDQSELAS